MRSFYWRICATSVIGPGHIASGLPNQDAWATWKTHRYGCLAVADGLGSRPHSDIGSKSACHAAVIVAQRHVYDKCFYARHFVDELRLEWLAAIRPFSPEECATTCIVAMWSPRFIRLFQIGDGLAAAVMRDGRVVALSDDKSESFSNLVNPLSATTSSGEWRMSCVLATHCVGVLLCTDGISDDLSNLSGFATACVADLASGEATAPCWANMLENWPVPAHSDDKTMAVLARRRWLK